MSIVDILIDFSDKHLRSRVLFYLGQNPDYNALDAFYEAEKFFSEVGYFHESTRTSVRRVNVALGHCIEVPKGEKYDFRLNGKRYLKVPS